MLNFEILRKIAETASGLRNQDLWFVVRDGNFDFLTEKPREVPEGAVVIAVEKTDDPPPRVTAACITDGIGKPVDLMKVTVPPRSPYPGGTYSADAVFWSISAVEKFVLPYYASVYGDQAPEIVREVLEILRPAPSTMPLESAPFAIAHLPSSEYVGLVSPVEGGHGPTEGHCFLDNMFLLRNGHAEPITHHLRHRAPPAARPGIAAEAPAAPPPPTGAGENGAEPHSGNEIPRTNGSRSRYARTAGR